MNYIFEILNAHIMGESCPKIDRIENCSKKVSFIVYCVYDLTFYVVASNIICQLYLTCH